MSVKDSKGLFANVKITPDATAPGVIKATSPHLNKVAGFVQQLHDKGEAFDRLLAQGEQMVEIAPEHIAPSLIADRFDGSYEEQALQQLVTSMQERGQVVPGLVRPIHGDLPYQIVFGRRRLAAAKKLGVPFKAIVRTVTDDEAIVLQGEENTNRADLTFVEKCVFAQAQQDAGYSRDVTCQSISVDRHRLSDMLKVATTVPRNILISIGSAPEIGRRRWLDFASAWEAAEDAENRVADALKNAEDNRFLAAARALAERSSKPEPRRAETAGLVLATAEFRKSGARLTFTKAVPNEFVEFVGQRLEGLHNEFMKTRKG